MKGIYAQNQFKGIVVNIDGEPITGAQLMLSEGDQLVAISLASEEGKFSIENIPSGTFLLEINALGYAEYVQTFTFDKDLLDLRFVLQPDSAMTLGELEVVGDRVRQTATGEVYFLSEKAKSSRNPFVALSEIPRLRVNVAIQSIKMEDGTSPIVLVDGKPVNTGVNPINPEDIASVEMIEVVSARYLQKGYQNILNIKLKSKRRPYQFFQVAARSDILPGNGFGVGYFEVGNTKVSLFGRLSLNGTLNRNSDYEQWQEDTDFHKASKGASLVNNRGVNGDLILKWQIGERDYM
ncbi:carboxypeptidase regulatory-like domain-containing protein, partial [Porphyromonadaceae bacterium W3.11]|nr:carboxypeptidase regulatory-like domain-containing protein [Porphyromonadaceae bacterium W3.11]